MMGISILQLVVVALLVAAVVVLGKLGNKPSETSPEQTAFRSRLFRWAIMSVAAIGVIYAFPSYFFVETPSIVVNIVVAIFAFEAVRRFEKTYVVSIAYFIAVPVVVLFDHIVGTYLYINVSNPANFLGNFSEFINSMTDWSDIIYFQSLLINAAILTAVASILLRFKPSSFPSTAVNQYTTSVFYGGLAVNDRKNEANRYAMSHALLGGSSFRREIIDRAKDKYNAVTNELGLDFEALLKSCLYFEKRENKFRGIFVALIIFCGVGVVSFNQALVALSVFAMIATQIVKSYQERFKYVREFRDREFDTENFIKKHKVPFDAKDYPGIADSKGKNVSIYKGYVPFEGAGWEMGGWSFAVDLARPKDNLGAKTSPEKFGIFEIYGALDSAITKLGIPNLSIEDHFFVNGVDITAFNELLPGKFAKPQQKFNEKLMASYQAKTDGLIRHYKWIQIKDWGNDLINSFFVRYEMRGDNLFLEASKYLLTPIDTMYRKLDSVLPFTFMNNVVWLVGSIVKTIFTVISSLIYTYINVMKIIADAFGMPDRAMKKLIRNSVNYNYGAPVSMRQKMSSPNFMHYYQKMDNEMYLKTLERQIIDATVDFLEAHNIDVSEIKERGSTILNSGVFVQGGDVKAQTLAVGKGAKAETKGILSKVRKSPATA